MLQASEQQHPNDHAHPIEHVADRCQLVTEEDIANYRRIINSFKADTAVGHDNIPPRSLSVISDSTLRYMIALYKRAECEGRWPDIWRIATMVMIPKTEAFKYRLIALLTTFYRVWASLAGEQVSRWMTGLRRVWMANPPEKSGGACSLQNSAGC